MLWVLECVSMLCDPTPALRAAWNSKEECRQAVIRNLNSRPAKDRFTWRCTPLIDHKIIIEERTAEQLERP